MRPALSAILVLTTTASSVPAGETFSLTHVAAGDQAQPILQMTMRGVGGTDEKPAGLTGPPEAKPDTVRYFRLPVEEKPPWAAVVAGTPPKLYVDADADFDLSDETPIEETAEGGPAVFASVALSGATGARARIRSMKGPGSNELPLYLLIGPAGYVAGEASLGGKTYRVGFVDGNLNGRYNDAVDLDRGFGDADIALVDLDGDGQFDRPSPPFDAIEMTPLARGTRIDSGYYRFDVAPDGTSVRVAKMGPEFGTLDLGGPDVEMIVMSDFGYQAVRAVDGKARVPAGRYLCLMLRLTRTDEDGAGWVLSGRGGEKLGRFRVEADQTFKVEAGPPLTAATTVHKQPGGAVLIGFALRGTGGAEYAPGAEKDGRMLPAPTFEIVDEAGKVVHTGKFEYA